jgi:hypothetical protein
MLLVVHSNACIMVFEMAEVAIKAVVVKLK